MIPLPVEAEPDIVTAFEQEAELEGFVLTEDGLLPESKSTPYCRVEIPHPTTDESQILVFVLSEQRMQEHRFLTEQSMSTGRRPPRLFNLQFARKVVANLLGEPLKANWKHCVQTEDEEKAMADYIKQLI
jgi:hypothetical protein